MDTLHLEFQASSMSMPAHWAQPLFRRTTGFKYGRWGCYIMKFQFSTEINRIIYQFWKRTLGLIYYDIPIFNRVQSGLHNNLHTKPCEPLQQRHAELSGVNKRSHHSIPYVHSKISNHAQRRYTQLDFTFETPGPPASSGASRQSFTGTAETQNKNRGIR